MQYAPKEYEYKYAGSDNLDGVLLGSVEPNTSPADKKSADCTVLLHNIGIFQFLCSVYTDNFREAKFLSEKYLFGIFSCNTSKPVACRHKNELNRKNDFARFGGFELLLCDYLRKQQILHYRTSK